MEKSVKPEELCEETQHAIRYGRFSNIPEEELTPLEKLFKQAPKPDNLNPKILEKITKNLQGKNNEK